MRRGWILLGGILMLVLVGVRWSPVQAEDCGSDLDCLGQEIAKLSQALEQSRAATTPLEAELDKLEDQLAGIEAGIAKAKEDLRALEASIARREVDFATQYVLLSERVQSFYKSSRAPSSFFVLFASGPSSNLARDLFYRSVVTDRDKDIIAKISQELMELENDKKKAEEDKARLADLQVKLDKEAEFFRGEIAGAKAYQEKLSSQIAALTAKQQQIIAEKLGTLGLPQSLGAGPLVCVDDRDEKYNPGFSPALAFFTYGIPHRVGMNQYGAYGRAKAGQNYKTILGEYFGGIAYAGGKENVQINIQGYGLKPLDEYLLGIYEMPEDWPMEALKAQAVAARSYALAYTNNGAGEICTTQACQVWKPEPKTGQWKQAVEQTRGEIMMYGGEIVKAWYSSTDGGYTHTSGEVWGSDKGWTRNLRDTSGDIGSFGDLNAKAFDRDSPCFYAAQGSRAEYNKSAWLKANEVVDIANVILLARADSSVKNHLYQVDKPNPEGVETWDEARVRQELSNRGVTPVGGGSNVSVSGVDFGGGRTTQVTVNGASFSGSEFKDWFNLRAPANIQIVGPLYNVEKR